LPSIVLVGAATNATFLITMPIKGTLKIQLIDARSHRLKGEIEATNLITNLAYESVLNSIPSNVWGVSQVFVSDSQVPPDPSTTLVNYLAVGSSPITGSEYSYFLDFDPPFMEVTNIINPPATGTRTFYSVGLKQKGGTPQRVLAITLLDLPCVQDSETFINIFYRVQYPDLPIVSKTIVNPVLLRKKYVEDISSNSNSLRTDYALITPMNLNDTDREYLQYNNNTSFFKSHIYDDNNPAVQQDWTNSINITNLFKRKFTKSSGTNRDILTGRIYRSILYPYNSIETTWHGASPLQAGTYEPIGAIFIHRGTELVPFFDPVAFGTGQGKIKFGGAWTGKVPNWVQILITTDGATGVSQYKWRIKKTMGFDGNSYEPINIPNLWKNTFALPYARAHGWQDTSNDVLAYSSSQVVTYDATGVSIVDVMDGSHIDYDALTTPALAATNIGQVACSRFGKIYVACRDSGLYEIDQNAIVRLINAPCYGVDVGRNGKVWAVAQGGVYNDGDWNTALNITYADLVGNWQRAYFLKADPEHAEDRIALAYDKTGVVTIVWINGSTRVATQGSGASCTSAPASFDVSDTGSFWAGYNGSAGYILTWNSTARTNISFTLYFRSVRAKISFYKQYLIGRSNLIAANNTSFAVYKSLGQLPDGASNVFESNFITHLGDGLVVAENFIRHLFSTPDVGWTTYGWDGTKWVEGLEGAKNTHADLQALFEGLTIQFINGTNPPHFVAGERFNCPISWGLWKNNVTTFNLETAWYSKPVVEQPLNTTIPNAAPYEIVLTAASQPDFYAIESDSLGLLNITINGVPPTNKRVGTAAPGPMEVTLNTTTNKLIFNAADAGALVAGSYVWIKT
jgi:hypothetical protein